jgi:hypothetical protein
VDNKRPKHISLLSFDNLLADFWKKKKIAAPFFSLYPYIPSQLSHLNGHQKQNSKAKLRIRCGVTRCSSFFVNVISILNFNYCLIVINFNKKKSILCYQLNFLYTQKLKVRFLNSNNYLKGSNYIRSIIVS